MKKYQLIVIGGGAGGLTTAAGAASMGMKVALIEKDENLGGDCLHYGCVPSKALIHAAKNIYTAKQAAKDFGFSIQGEAELKKAKERVKAAIKDIQVHDSKERFKRLGICIYQGKGHFIDKNVVQIDDGEKIFGKRIVISTGSRPVIPPIEGIDLIDYLTNESIFELEAAPKRMAVVGAGPIGLELSQSLARFGSTVTVLESSDRLMAHEDEEIIPFLKKALEKELTIQLNSKVTKVEKKGEEKILTVDHNGKIEKLIVDAVLIATGRKANIDSLGLESIGVETKNGHITVNSNLQTSQKHIYAIGDTIGTFPFTHAAGMEGKVVVANAVFGLKRKVNYDAVPWITFTDPEIYHLGLTEKEARNKYGDEIIDYNVGFDDVDRFIAERNKEGLLKIITDKKGYILGAHAVGTGAGDWMQAVVYAKQYKKKISTISNVIHPYPTRGGVVQRAADQYWRKKLFEGSFSKIVKNYIEWFR